MMVKKFFEKVSVAVLSASLFIAMMPASVLARDFVTDGTDGGDMTVPLVVETENSPVTVNRGDITVPANARVTPTVDEYAVDIQAEGQDANVTVGDVTRTGNIENTGASGVSVMNDFCSVNISTNNIYADNIGLYSLHCGQVSNITINGDITGNDCVVSDNSCGQITITVNGNLYADRRGIELHNLSDYNNEYGTNVTVNGNIESDAIGIDATGVKAESKTKIVVNGDVTGGKQFDRNHLVGIVAGIPRGGEMNILITGTLSSENSYAPIYHTDRKSDGLNITVWKIEPKVEGDKEIIATDSFTDGEDTELESKIRYIIKMEQPASEGSFGVTDESGTALSKVDGWSWAHEGDKVMLKASDGYVITGAYNGQGNKIALEKDAAGNYYIIVPRGGGVYLSVDMDKAAVLVDNPVSVQKVSSSSEQKSSASAPEEDGFEAFNSMVAQMIRNAAPNENVKVNAAYWPGFGKTVIDALKARPDVSLTVDYANNGTRSILTIPAGYDMTAVVNAAGGVDFAALAAALGSTIAQ